MSFHSLHALRPSSEKSVMSLIYSALCVFLSLLHACSVLLLYIQLREAWWKWVTFWINSAWVFLTFPCLASPCISIVSEVIFYNFIEYSLLLFPCIQEFLKFWYLFFLMVSFLFFFFLAFFFLSFIVWKLALPVVSHLQGGGERVLLKCSTRWFLLQVWWTL